MVTLDLLDRQNRQAKIPYFIHHAAQCRLVDRPADQCYIVLQVLDRQSIESVGPGAVEKTFDADVVRRELG